MPTNFAQLYGVYGEDVAHLINTQVGTANYFLQPVSFAHTLPDVTFSTNEAVWRALLSENLRANLNMKLREFFLFEWFPRSPGLFHTWEGKEARRHARMFLKRVPIPRLLPAQRLWSRDKENEQREFLDIYDPYGKCSMLKGGIGCIRLRSKLLGSGDVWFMSASSTGVAHEGFPVAVPNGLYQHHIDDIRKAGALRCTLAGTLRFLPDPLVELYRGYRGVPQLYLLVEDLWPQTTKQAGSIELLVTAGVGFLSNYEGYGKMYASYATFDPARPGSVDETAGWLEDVYVKGLYQGNVVTDFDEQMARFANATFSLKGIMQNALDKSAVETFVGTVNVYGRGSDIGALFSGLNRIETLKIGRVEKMEHSQTITIGPGATVTAPVVIAEDIRDSFNTLRKAEVGEPLRGQLEGLLKAVTEANRLAPSESAVLAARDAKNLIEEATATPTRPEVSRRFAEQIKSWAVTIGEAGKPIVELIATILPLLQH